MEGTLGAVVWNSGPCLVPATDRALQAELIRQPLHRTARSSHALALQLPPDPYEGRRPQSSPSRSGLYPPGVPDRAECGPSADLVHAPQIGRASCRERVELTDSG